MYTQSSPQPTPSPNIFSNMIREISNLKDSIAENNPGELLHRSGVSIAVKLEFIEVMRKVKDFPDQEKAVFIHSLAHDLGISESTVDRYINGKSIMSRLAIAPCLDKMVRILDNLARQN